jgi:hypothetical protein
MVATEVLSLIHEPPAVVLFNVVVAPSHSVKIPVIDDGNGFTVKLIVEVQPEKSR